MTLTITTGMNRFPAENPKSWDFECDMCEEERLVSPHVVIYTEDRQLRAGPECGQRRHQYAAAGHLALAGVRIGPAEDGCCELLDHEQLEQAVAALNAAGADVTVALD